MATEAAENAMVTDRMDDECRKLVATEIEDKLGVSTAIPARLSTGPPFDSQINTSPSNRSQ